VHANGTITGRPALAGSGSTALVPGIALTSPIDIWEKIEARSSGVDEVGPFGAVEPSEPHPAVAAAMIKAMTARTFVFEMNAPSTS
jgi:hypothetical protein